ncbi:cytochrome c oxidase assembly protein [Salinithrix halophila]|uniref:Cytochrome c oxidase assembly protein n=1 Tax=Salinithrix halophila TaxID=1485204 RepID=A0ABV8JFH9_9BACL
MHQHHGDPTIPDFWGILSPGTLLITLVLAVLYFAVIGPWKDRIGGAGQSVQISQKISFVCGLLIYYLATGPVQAFAPLLFSAHMTEMALIYLAMPPLLLFGTPAWLIRPLWNGKKRERVLHFFTQPLITLILFNGFFSLYHLPVVFDTVMSYGWLMSLSHWVLTVSAFLMWWPVICPLPEKDHLSHLQKMAYIFGDGVLLTPACAIIAFSDVLLYSTYQGGSQVFSFLQPLDDQSLGGVAMKIIQELAYGGVLGYTFFQWVKKQRREDADELAARKKEKDTDVSSVSFNH